MPKEEKPIKVTDKSYLQNDLALLFAAEQNQTLAIIQLLKRGANVSIRNDKDLTPIELSAENQNWEALIAFSDYPTDSADSANYSRALLTAIKYGKYEVACALLLAGANMTQTLSGDTPSHLAVRANAPDIILLLYRFGCQFLTINEQDKLTPYHLACKLGYWNSIIPMFWEISDFEAFRLELVDELTLYAKCYFIYHQERAVSFIDVLMRKVKTFPELKDLLKLEIDLFNPFFQKMHTEEKPLVKCMQLPKNNKDRFNDIIEKYYQNLKDKLPKDIFDKSLSEKNAFFRAETLMNLPSAPPATNPSLTP